MSLRFDRVAQHRIFDYAISLMLVCVMMYDFYDKEAYDDHSEDSPASQSRHQTKSHWTKAQRDRFKRATRVLTRTIVILHIMFGIKYLLVGLLYFDMFAEYRYYDCYILGRLAFSSISYRPTVITMNFITTYTLTYRLLTRRRFAAFNFEVLRFVQLDQEEVLWNEIDLNNTMSDRARRLTTDNEIKRRNSRVRNLKKSLTSYDRQSADQPNSGLSAYGKFKFYFENPFQTLPNQPDSNLLRPTRTSRAWHTIRTLVAIIQPSLIVMAVVVSLAWVLFVLSTAVTAKGFEVNYENCIKYIKTLSAEESAAFSHIYKPDNRRDHSGRWWVQLPEVNSYHVVRIIADLLDNLFVWGDSLCASTLHSLLLAFYMIDLIVYELFLEEKLLATISSLRYEAGSNSRMNSFRLDMIRFGDAVDADATRPDALDRSSYESISDCRTSDVQAYILDYMRMIDSYKHYSRFQTIAVWIVWILWTSVTSFWLANNKHSDLVEEFLWGQVGLAFVAISCMTFSSYFESRSRRLYHLICVAMALDTNVLSTKKRWYQLTKFFYPKPMYCFAFFDTSELSYLFCMKMVTWVTTAAFIISNFYTIYSK